MIPVLYKANSTNFDTFGIGVLKDCTSCEVTEERNGAYECVLKYPITGALYKEICTERLVKVKPKTYCKRNALGGTVSNQPGSTEKMCKCCGATLVQTPGRKRKIFCSAACRTKWWNAHPELVKHRGEHQVICGHCGQTFSVSKNSARKYCSHGCYIADRFHGGELQ